MNSPPRPAPGLADDARIKQLAIRMRVFVTIPDLDTSGLFRPGGPLPGAAPWLDTFHTAGRQLGEAARTGSLERRLRAILTYIMIFHWNRFGLSTTTQAILARAATTSLLPRF